MLAVARGYLVVNESLGEPKLIAGVLAAAVGYWITIMSTSMVHALIENTTYQIADNTMPTLDVLILLFAFSYYCFVRTFALLTMTILYPFSPPPLALWFILRGTFPVIYRFPLRLT